jgi:hypothetical protein
MVPASSGEKEIGPGEGLTSGSRSVGSVLWAAELHQVGSVHRSGHNLVKWQAACVPRPPQAGSNDERGLPALA